MLTMPMPKMLTTVMMMMVGMVLMKNIVVDGEDSADYDDADNLSQEPTQLRVMLMMTVTTCC